MRVQKVITVSPRGFCAGVERAVRAVEGALDIFGAPVYVKHQIVHNKHVVGDLEAKGARTIEDLSEVPDGAVVVFSAHGSTPAQYVEAKRRNLRVIDATCPLVTKVHLEMQRFLRDGFDVIYIGHSGHIEGIGVTAESTEKPIPMVETVEDVERLSIGNPEKLAYLTQTTLSVFDTGRVIEALKKKYPHIVAPPLSDICYATTNRQEAIQELAKVSDLVLVLGSKSSSNSTRLMEAARATGCEAHLIEDIHQLDPAWMNGVSVVGLSAGASGPEHLIQESLAYFVAQGAIHEELNVRSERMEFSDPLELMNVREEQKNKKEQ